MQKTKIGVEIHANGTLNEAIIRMVTSNNEGKYPVPASLISMRCKCYYAEWPTISPEFKTIESTDGTMQIYEGEKATLTLTFKEIHELIEITESEANRVIHNLCS